VTDGVLADFNRYFDSVYRSFEKDLKKAAKGYSYLEFRNRVLSAEESGLSFYTQMLLNLTTDGTLATEYLRNLNDPLEVHRERIGILNKYTTLFGNYVRQDIDRKKLARIVISLFTFDES
jgi:chromosome condensin MukBEF MukE localization factor